MESKILCFHLLNDFSGSPLVFSQSIDALLSQGRDVEIYTNKSEGFLSKFSKDKIKYINYNWSSYKLVTLFRFFFSQMVLFFRLLTYWNSEVVFYVNTVLPIGAALAAKVMNKRLVYHLHETSIKPQIFKKLLFGIAESSADELVYVSHFLKDQEPLSVKSTVIYNALPDSFISEVSQFGNKTAKDKNGFTVLMLCSLKKYKGVDVFVELAEKMPSINFELVCNADQKQINEYFSKTDLSPNLKIFSSQKNVHPFYQRSDLVLNLSHPELWMETFGMTALEAMVYGKPVIVPPVGGIAELVPKNRGGFQIDSRKLNDLISCINLLKDDTVLYKELVDQAVQRASEFSGASFKKNILSVVCPDKQWLTDKSQESYQKNSPIVP